MCGKKMQPQEHPKRKLTSFSVFLLFFRSGQLPEELTTQPRQTAATEQHPSITRAPAPGGPGRPGPIGA